MGHGMGYAGDDPEYRWLRHLLTFLAPLRGEPQRPPVEPGSRSGQNTESSVQKNSRIGCHFPHELHFRYRYTTVQLTDVPISTWEEPLQVRFGWRVYPDDVESNGTRKSCNFI